jgi:hypothetical protein
MLTARIEELREALRNNSAQIEALKTYACELEREVGMLS